MPKPRPENILRAARISAALATQYDLELEKVDSIIDALADLLHYCSQKKISFGYALRVARSHYDIETKNPSKETAL
jgi:hypothetical protein